MGTDLNPVWPWVQEFADKWREQAQPSIRPCAICDGPLDPFGVVLRYYTKGRGQRRHFDAICVSCMFNPPARVTFVDRYAVDEETHVCRPCEGCGQLIWRRDDPRLTRWACSTACRIKAWRAEQEEVERADKVCYGCSNTFSPSRADAIYCSAACKQRAYRIRSTSG